MKKDFITFKDFNNTSLKVTLDHKKYNGILMLDGNRIILKVNMSNDIEKWRKINYDCEIITGCIIFDNQPITLLNCICTGNSYTVRENGKNEYEIEYIVDRILLGYKLSSLNIKKINKFLVKYDSIDSFTNDRTYNFNNKSLEYTSTSSDYFIEIKNLLIRIHFTCKIKHSEDSLLIDRNTIVEFNEKIKCNILKVLEEIYKLRIFMIILLKRHLIVKKQEVFINDEKYELFDCRSEKPYLINEDILKRKRIKIEKISNLNEVYQSFSDNYKKLYPVLEIYYNSISCFTPDLSRFIIGTTALEYISNEFDSSNAVSISRKYGSKKVDYIHMVEGLITNVNSVLNYTSTDIPIVANNVKEARVYYIHYNKKRKQLTEEEQQYYSYFVFDVLLLNIYKVIKLDISIFNYSCYKDIYYVIEDIL